MKIMAAISEAVGTAWNRVYRKKQNLTVKESTICRKTFKRHLGS